MQVIQGAHAITIIADEKLKNEVVNAVGKENVLRVRPSLVEISVKSPEKIMETSGVFSYLASNLSENNVNVAESVSCYTDTIFIVDEKDFVPHRTCSLQRYFSLAPRSFVAHNGRRIVLSGRTGPAGAVTRLPRAPRGYSGIRVDAPGALPSSGFFLKKNRP